MLANRYKDLFLFFSLFIFTTVQAASTDIEFYSEQLHLEYHSSIVIDFRVKCNERSIRDFYDQMELTKYQQLLDDLAFHQTNLQLNDWLYHELLRNSIHKIYAGKSELQKTLTAWFLLAKSGYDARLTYLKEEAYLYVYTNDNLFEVPMIQEGDRLYVNLSNLDAGRTSYAAEVYMLDFVPQRRGKAFSFYLNQLPKLNPQTRNRALNFRYKNQQFTIQAKMDMTIIELMKNYPIIDETQYLEIPLSSSLSNSILPQLRQIIKGKSQKEALEILVTFTRSAFKYKEDHEYFGRSKPMIADEVFHYPYSDCEDRSALFYNLVKRLLNLPMIMIAYPDHLTIGVALNQDIGAPISYKGKKYYICDPTGPTNSVEIGRIPKNYERKPFEILADYKG